MSIPFRSSLGAIENAALDEFLAKNEAFSKQANKSQKSEYSEDLKLLEKERKSFWKEVNRITKSYVKSADPMKRAAAETVQAFIDPYSMIDDLSLNSKTGVISEIMGKYRQNIKVQQAAALIGLDTSFGGMETKNVGFHTLYNSRNDEYAAHETPSTLLKPATVASYNQFCTAIEQAANLTPNESIITLFHKLDELRKTYHALSGTKDVPPVDGTTK